MGPILAGIYILCFAIFVLQLMFHRRHDIESEYDMDIRPEAEIIELFPDKVHEQRRAA